MSSIKNHGQNPIKEVLRTPMTRFKNLPGYNFNENYVLLQQQSDEHQQLRMHYIDEGNRYSKEIVLLLHGEPTWSYLYRNFIPILAQKGYRVIAPDLIGFGKSDKPANQEDFTYKRKIRWLTQFINQLDLKNITLFCQDWGGLIGLRVVSEQPDRFARVIIANTTLPTGDPQFESKYFLKWATETSQKMQNWGTLMQLSTIKKMRDDIAQAYEAPYPGEKFKSATRVAPKLVPITKQHPEANENEQALQFFSKWRKPFLTLFSDKDPIFAGGDKFWQKLVPGARGQKHQTISQAGHFLQEDQPEEICRHIIQFIQDNQTQEEKQGRKLEKKLEKNLFPKL